MLVRCAQIDPNHDPVKLCGRCHQPYHQLCADASFAAGQCSACELANPTPNGASPEVVDLEDLVWTVSPIHSIGPGMDTKQKRMLRKAEEEQKKAEDEKQRKDKRAATSAAKRKSTQVEAAKKKPKDKKSTVRSATQQHTQPDTAADMEPEADQATVQNTRSTRSGTGLYDFTASQQALPVKKRRAKK